MQGSTYFVTWRLAKQQPDLAPNERTLVVEALRHFDGQRYELMVYVVMNDHVHSLVTPAVPHRLEAIVHSWKSFTANRITKASCRQGKIWQSEYFDRLIRSEAEFLEKATYIMQNPTRRWPDLLDYAWMGVGGAPRR